MKIAELEEILNENRNADEALKMSGYLKDQFEFLGIPKTKLKTLQNKFIKDMKEDSIEEILKTATILHKMPYREYMYIAQSLLQTYYKKMSYNNIKEMIDLTTINSWWENTDGYINVVKRWLKDNDDMIDTLINDYYLDDNFWKRRVALLCQLGLRDQVNFEAMQKAIFASIDYDEFFIQKAVGWALRDYGHFNPDVIVEFAEENKDKLSKLAYREAVKNLS